ncbi:MAG: hypothetical protein K8W52_45710 [Deltaproteobacteria bacterium]|nr:hypothetical protein [Deltaproteobacteria bacterium]
MYTPWLRRVFLLAALAAAPLAACGGGTKPGTTLQNGGAPAGSLAAALTTELGTPVAILPNKTGLLAVSADGARQHLLVPAPVDWALVDNRAGVVWFGTRDSIRLLDLTLAAPAPEVIVDALPTDVIEGAPGIVIDYGEDGDLSIGHPAYHRITLGLGATPGLTGDSGAWTDDEEFPKAVAARALAPAVRTRLVELWHRGAGKALASPAPTDPATQVAGVDPANCPDDESMCGAASAIPGTKLWRVTVSFSCGDGCHPEYRAYDPATKQFIDDPWAGHLQMTWISGDGHALVQDGGITRLDGHGAGFAASEGVEGGGWLGPSWYVPF